jgi:PleD family two-component response regulator
LQEEGNWLLGGSKIKQAPFPKRELRGFGYETKDSLPGITGRRGARGGAMPKIMVVDDEAIVQLIKLLMEREQFEVIEAYNGLEAYHKLIEDSPR